MIARQGTWGELQVGMYVKGADEVWRVASTARGKIALQNRGGERNSYIRPPDQRPVTILESTWAEAKATIERLLGGEEITDGIESVQHL